ncbi:hypothetical protein [Bacillus cereus]|nr:hypothetical protein [Bacillus cereus]HDR8031850.1 hypothetical protein [Bacillus cereus]HDR8428787.1 hypothetical protein [Bacillus cereus]HDR8446749.1 hypothetical protein [Bacillus cereus]
MTGGLKYNGKWYYFTSNGDMVLNTKLDIKGLFIALIKMVHA